jgi:hypothetical protein
MKKTPCPLCKGGVTAWEGYGKVKNDGNHSVFNTSLNDLYFLGEWFRSSFKLAQTG